MGNRKNITIACLVVTLVFTAATAWVQELEYPVDVGIDAKGVIFVADHQAHALFKLDGDSLKIVASGEGVPRTPLYGIRHIAAEGEGRWVASDPATMKLYRIGSAGEITPLPDDDRLVTPWGIAVEPSGTILTVDRLTNRLYRLSADGKTGEVAQVQAPRAVLFDKRGAIIVLTDRNLMRVDDQGKVEPLLENPPFEFPHDAAFHRNGNFYVTDGYARAIWQVSPQGEVSALVQGDPLMSPQGLAVDGKGNLLVADAHARSVFLVTPEGKISTLAR